MDSIGPYRLESELGHGAMGVVFRGFDPAIGRAVAIKLIQLNQFATATEKAELKLRLAREAGDRDSEAQALAALAVIEAGPVGLAAPGSEPLRLLAEARQRGQDLVLDVLLVNERARALYERLGLTEVAPVSDGDVRVSMRSASRDAVAG